VGSAAAGALLQNRLATTIHDQAVAYAPQIPSQYRQAFVDGFTNAAKGSLEVGRSSGSTAALHLGNVPASAAAQLSRIAHDVFAYGFIDAVRPTLLFPICVLLIGAASCFALISGRAAPRPAVAPTMGGSTRQVLWEGLLLGAAAKTLDGNGGGRVSVDAASLRRLLSAVAVQRLHRAKGDGETKLPLPPDPPDVEGAAFDLALGTARELTAEQQRLRSQNGTHVTDES
jgi:hypothetical protein